MKKSLFFIFFTLIFFTSCKNKEEKMLDYMKNRYGEEFVLGFAGGRGDTLIVNTMPKRYLGTPKERDKYYHGQIFYERNDIGDNYGAVVINEGANEYVRPKLEELFGKNILIALNLEGEYKYPNFQKELNRRKENRKDYMFSCEAPLSGGIYIFGRVENEKDREKYRKGIYEFIQYLKQEGMFECTRIDIQVLDERMLSKAFNENAEAIESLRELGSKIAATKRNKILNPYNEDFKKTSQEYKDKWIENIRKSNISEDTYNSILLYTVIRSPKYVKSKGLDTDKRINETLRNYDKIDDVIFKIEGYKID